MLLPEPDSPTSASVSPRWICNDKSVTTGRDSPCFENAIDRFSMLRRGRVMSYRLVGIEGIAHGFANKNQQGKQHSHGEECGDAQPGGLEVVFALQQQFAKRR